MTIIRPEVSIKNQYWISRHRYYELKHFCLQYPEWGRMYDSINEYAQRGFEPQAIRDKYHISDPTAKTAESKAHYMKLIEMVELAAREANPDLAEYVLKAVTEGLSFTYLKMQLGIPCCKEVYYKAYRKFFWLLSNVRD